MKEREGQGEGGSEERKVNMNNFLAFCYLRLFVCLCVSLCPSRFSHLIFFVVIFLSFYVSFTSLSLSFFFFSSPFSVSVFLSPKSASHFFPFPFTRFFFSSFGHLTASFLCYLLLLLYLTCPFSFTLLRLTHTHTHTHSFLSFRNTFPASFTPVLSSLTFPYTLLSSLPPLFSLPLFPLRSNYLFPFIHF